MKRVKKRPLLLLTFVLFMSLLAASATATEAVFDGGTGTLSDPYRISTADQLAAMSQDLGAHYELAADIDLAGVDNWVPVGYVDFGAATEEGMFETAFSGVFDGKDHAIKNITANHPELIGVGLFGLTGPDAVVKNLVVDTASSTGYMSVGGIIGYNMGTADRLTLKGENAAAGVNSTGAIVGGNDYGTLSNLTVESAVVTVLGDNDFPDGRIIQADVAECGGLIVGGSFGGTIENCTAKGTIIALGNEPIGLGGIGGCLEYMEYIANCTADVAIDAPNAAHAVGGLCGYAGTGDAANPARIENCAVTVALNVPGATHVGGLVGTGLYYMGMETVFEITDCSADGAIDGAEAPGAVAGRAEGSAIRSCETSVRIDGVQATEPIGTTDRMYESADQ